MDDGYVIEQQENYLIIRLLRVLQYDEVIAMLDRVVACDRCGLRLWHLGTYNQFSPDELTAIGDYARGLRPRPTRVAYVVDNDVSHGLTNIHAVYRDPEDYQIFRDEEEALAWLTEAGPAD